MSVDVDWDMITHFLVIRSQQRCEICGTKLTRATATRHHRQPRGMGGTKDPDQHRLDRLMLLCGGSYGGVMGCHGLRVELDRALARAEENGWLVPHGNGPAADCAQVPVKVYWGRDHQGEIIHRRVLLDPYNPNYLPLPLAA